MKATNSPRSPMAIVGVTEGNTNVAETASFCLTL